MFRRPEKPKNSIFRYIILIVGLLFILIMYFMMKNMVTTVPNEDHGYPIELME